MELEFAFVAGREFSFVQAFANRFDLPMAQNKVLIPPAMGRGYLRQVRPNNGLPLALHRSANYFAYEQCLFLPLVV